MGSDRERESRPGTINEILQNFCARIPSPTCVCWTRIGFSEVGQESKALHSCCSHCNKVCRFLHSFVLSLVVTDIQGWWFQSHFFLIQLQHRSGGVEMLFYKCSVKMELRYCTGEQKSRQYSVFRSHFTLVNNVQPTVSTLYPLHLSSTQAVSSAHLCIFLKSVIIPTDQVQVDAYRF